MSRIAAAAAVVVVVFVLGPSGVRFFFFFFFFFGGAATSLVPASVRARALESVRTCEKSAPAFFVEKRSEDEKIEDGVFARTNTKKRENAGSKKLSRVESSGVPPFVCPHTV
jgi:hypothetical protein